MPKFRVTVYDSKNPKNEGISVHEVEGENEVAMLDALSLVVPWDELICVKLVKEPRKGSDHANRVQDHL